MPGRSTTENEDLIREYYEAWDAGDPDRIATFFAEDFSTKYTDWTGTEIRVTRETVQDWITGWLDVMTEMTHEIHDIVADGDTVMVHVTYRGIHDGEVHGIEPTGNRVEVAEYLTFHIEDGEIVTMDWLSDDLALLRQLGVELPIEE